MTHLNPEQIAAYRTRALDAAEVLRVSDHLAECNECRELALGETPVASGAMRMRRSLASASEPFPHLTYHQISASVDGQLSGAEAETVKIHARACATCAADLRQLQRLKTDLEAGRRSAVRPERVPFFLQALQSWRVLGGLAAAVACLFALALTLRHQPVPLANDPPVAHTPVVPAPVIHDGSRTFALAANGQPLNLDGLPEQYRAAVAQALTTLQVDPPAGSPELSTKRDVLLGPSAAPEQVHLLRPIGLIVESQRPTFEWKPAPGAQYQVSVYDSKFRQVATSPWTTESFWRSTTDLRRGVRYFWQITVRRGGGEFTVPAPPAAEARFRVLDAAAETELASLRTAWGDSHLVMGVAYARAGLVEDARRELQLLADENPDAAPIRVNGAQ
jgi:hypothetical protein